MGVQVRKGHENGKLVRCSCGSDEPAQRWPRWRLVSGSQGTSCIKHASTNTIDSQDRPALTCHHRFVGLVFPSPRPVGPPFRTFSVSTDFARHFTVPRQATGTVFTSICLSQSQQVNNSRLNRATCCPPLPCLASPYVVIFFRAQAPHAA